MAIIADACPDIERMIFKFNPEYFSNYLQVVIKLWNVYTRFIEIFQLTVFEKLRHFETWGGEFQASGLSHLLEIMGQRLEVLHLCHVEEIGFDDLIQITKCCRYYSVIGWRVIEMRFCVRNLRSLTIENCSFNIDESELNEENLYIKNMQVPMLLELRMFKVISIPLEMAMMILKKCLNIVNIEIDGEIDLTNEKVSELLQENNLAKLKHLMIYSSK